MMIVLYSVSIDFYICVDAMLFAQCLAISWILKNIRHCVVDILNDSYELKWMCIIYFSLKYFYDCTVDLVEIRE